MQIRDILTLIGAIFTAAAPVFILYGKTPTLFFIGQLLTVLGPVLVGSRSVIKDKDKTDDSAGGNSITTQDTSGVSKTKPLPLIIGAIALLGLSGCMVGCTQVDLKNGTVKTCGNSQMLTANYGRNAVHWDAMDHAIVITAAGAAGGNLAGSVLAGLTGLKLASSGMYAGGALVSAAPPLVNRHTNRTNPATPKPSQR